MDKEKILVIEDQGEIRNLIDMYLKKNGYTGLMAGSGMEGLDTLEDNPDTSLIILDVMLPDIDGFSIMKRLRKENNIPVIMLTARSEEEDRLFGFELGADDYVVKPFSPKELMARIKALLSRRQVKDNSLEYEGITIDENRHEVKVNGEEIDLTLKEYDLLVYFLKNKGMALSRDSILNNVWGYDYFGDLRTVDTHIKRLRKKLGDLGDSIETLRGVGYRIK